MMTLVLGGAGSGKSAFAEQLAADRHRPVAYIATGGDDRDDVDMAARIERHRRRRPPEWTTLEPKPDALCACLLDHRGMVIVDALGTWLARIPDFAADITALTTALRERDGDSVVVSDEVGLGVHPSTEVGRRFREALGALNQAVAAVADEVVLVIAGRPLHLPPAQPAESG